MTAFRSISGCHRGSLSLSLALLLATLESARGKSTAALHSLARNDDVAALKALGDLPTEKLNEKEAGTGQTPLMAATLAGAAGSVEYLLSINADATIGEKDGYTPFHGAGFQGRASVAKVLLKYKLDPSDRHKDGNTPLHRACWGRESRHTDVVRVLLKANVDPEEPSKDGKTCLDMTQNEGTKKVIKHRIKKKKAGQGKAAPEATEL
eukprot:TRINITY_DN12535_c0_g1_i1.p1 TRINITY_DN12535_c0_g1~~TRINITY_DN12535_c0_g1_i1.p1  ORF type:complete len:233 (-),score=37.91 TRINITY_DN12535_c0_g1_i1:39-662(-)